MHKDLNMYKGFNKDFTGLHGFQFAPDTAYHREGPLSQGFSACYHPLETFRYYPPHRGARYARVSLEGDTISIDMQGLSVCGNSLIVKEELTLVDLAQQAKEFNRLANLPYNIDHEPRAKAFAWQSYAVAYTTKYSSLAATNAECTIALTQGTDSVAVALWARSAAVTNNSSSVAVTTHHMGFAQSLGDNSIAAASHNHAHADGLNCVAAVSDYHGHATASYNRSVAAASGMYSQARALGQYSTAASSGQRGTAIATGYCSVAVATSEEGSALADVNACAALAVGESTEAVAKAPDSLAMALGYKSIASGHVGTFLVLAYRDECGILKHVKAVRVGEDGIQPNKWYRLNEAGEVEDV